MTRFPVFAGFLFVSMYVVLVVFAFSNTGGLTSAGVTLLFLPLPFFLVAALTSSTPELRRFFLGFGIPLLLYAFIAFIENTYPSERPFLFKLAGNPPVGNSQIYEFNPYSLASRLRVQKGSERSYSVRDPDLDRAFRDAVEKRLPGTFREPEDAWVVVGGIGDGDVPFDGPHDMLELKGPLRELAAKNGEKEQERFRTALLAWYALLDSVRPLDAMAVQGRYYVFIASFPDFR